MSGGSFSLTDPNGDIIQSYTLEIVPPGGTRIAHKVNVAFDYDIDGAGVDWSTLKVELTIHGLIVQPKVGDPDHFDIVNDEPALYHATIDQNKHQHTAQGVTITELLAGKAWDHARILTPSLGVTAKATAKVLPGYIACTGASCVDPSTITVSVGPIVGITSVEWKPPPATTTTATTATTATSTTATSSTVTTTDVAHATTDIAYCMQHMESPNWSPDTPYYYQCLNYWLDFWAEFTSTLTPQTPNYNTGIYQEQAGSYISTTVLHGGREMTGARSFELFGGQPVFDIYGANQVGSGDMSMRWLGVAILIVGVVAVVTQRRH